MSSTDCYGHTRFVSFLFQQLDKRDPWAHTWMWALTLSVFTTVWKNTTVLLATANTLICPVQETRKTHWHTLSVFQLQTAELRPLLRCSVRRLSGWSEGKTTLGVIRGGEGVFLLKGSRSAIDRWGKGFESSWTQEHLRERAMEGGEEELAVRRVEPELEKLLNR